MDPDEARGRLLAERAEVSVLLRDSREAGEEDRQAEADGVRTGDFGDAGQSLTAEGMDDAIAETMRARLEAIDRALHRIDEGTYGFSVRSGKPIPSERLEADPAAELTVEEAAAAERE